MQWRHVSPEEARQHPLYGVKGWLLFFMILIIIGLVFQVYSLLFPGPGDTVVGDIEISVNAGYASIMNIITIVLYAVVLFMAFSYNPSFPMAAIAVLWIGVVLNVIGMMVFPTTVTVSGGDPQMRAEVQEQINQTMNQSVYIGVIVSIVIAALLTWYFLSSKRVNVTYRHRVKA